MQLAKMSEVDLLLSGVLNLNSLNLGEIHDRYYRSIYRYALLRTGNANLADDIASEVFLRLLDAIHTGKPPHTTIKGWLFGVASHLVADHYQDKNEVPLIETISNGISIQVEAEQNILQEQVKTAFSKLTGEQREVLALRFSSGLTIKETAQLMNHSPSAVKALQFRALAALRKILVEIENE
jgi:RNA polymerase sigma-70 factor, ECF subfamily